MDELKYESVPHDHDSFLKAALARKGFKKAYDDLGEEYAFTREMLAARSQAGLSQEAVARQMGTTKSAVSRLESLYKHTPSMRTLQRYAHAVGCLLEIKFIPTHTSSQTSHSLAHTKKRSSR